MKNTDNKKEEVQEQSTNIFQKMLAQVKASGRSALGYASYENAVKVGSVIKSVAMTTKKIALSPLVSRTIVIGSAIAAFAGLSAVSPVFAGIGLASVAVGVGIDTYLVAKTRALHKESRYLARHRLAVNEQKNILSKSPKLETALGTKLYKPTKEGKLSEKDRLFQDDSKDKKTFWAYAQGTAKTITQNAVTIFDAAVNHNPLTILKAVGYTVWGISSSGGDVLTMEDKRNEFRQHIDLERSKSDSPGYNNRHELKKASHDQKVQTLTLMELTKDNSYLSQDKETINARFDAIKIRIEEKEKMFDLQYRPIAKIKNALVSALHAHNPFSKFNDVEKLSTKLSEKDIQLYKRPQISKELKENVQKIVDTAETKRQIKKETGTKRHYTKQKVNSQERF